MHRADPLVSVGRSPLALRFAHALEEQCQCTVGAPLLLAVSGGADSRALLLLTAALWKRKRALDQLAVICVDHQLRNESAQEAREVEKFAQSLGVRRVVVQTAKVSRVGNLEAAARAARWKAIATAMRRLDIAHVATAHHADDLFESFLFQLARKRGMDALAALPSRAAIPVRSPRGCTLIRPLRGIRKHELVALLESCQIDWSEDPTNAAPNQFRAQVRRLLQASGATLDPCVDGLARLCNEYAHEADQTAIATSPDTRIASRVSLGAMSVAQRRRAVLQLLRRAGCTAPQRKTLDMMLRAILDDEVRPRVFRFQGATVKLTRVSLCAEAIP